MFSSRLWQLFLDSFPKILLPGLTATIPLTIISFSLALVIAVVAALVQFANIQGSSKSPVFISGFSVGRRFWYSCSSCSSVCPESASFWIRFPLQSSSFL